MRLRLLILGLAAAVVAVFAADGLAAVLVGPFEKARYPGFAALLIDKPHSQMPLWMLGSIGSACEVLGGMLLLADWLPRAAWPLVATGQLALTVYVSHLLLLDAFPDLLKPEAIPETFLAVGVFMLIAVAVSSLWRAMLARGPLEAVLAAPWWIIEHLVRWLATNRGGREPNSSQ